MLRMEPLNIKRRQCQADDLPHTIHPVLRRVYSARGITTEQQLNHSVSEMLHVDAMSGVTRAVEMLSGAIQNNSRITIVGDFDADGATSTALCVLALRMFGHFNVRYLVPNRFETGYGLTPPIAEQAAEVETDVLLTVDNGISAISGVAKAKSLGMQVLVTDHHLPGDELPDADAIVNPNQQGCSFPSKNLAGVGVAFYLMAALRKHLAAQPWFVSRTQGQRINLADLLDIVALGTVADVVPLDQNNRILVHQGLQRIRAGKCRPGIRALCTVSKRDHTRLQSADLGFAIGPRLNAAGRLDDMALGIQCLLVDDEQSALAMAQQLDELNLTRREIERGMEQEALRELDKLMSSPSFQKLPKALCLYNPDWHQGVIGILASRVKDRFHRPVIAFAADENGSLKGSARSVSGVHMRDLLADLDTRHPELIDRFGGHAMAAGLSLKSEQFDLFQQQFEATAEQWIEPEQLEGILSTDGELSGDEFNMELALQIKQGGPWGQAFAEPQFDGVFQIIQQRLVGERHLKLVLKPDNGAAAIDAIAFNIDPATWPNHSAEYVRMVYQLDLNHFRGKTDLQLLVRALEAI